MIEVTKQITVQINGLDVETLKSMAHIAATYLTEHDHELTKLKVCGGTFRGISISTFESIEGLIKRLTNCIPN